MYYAINRLDAEKFCSLDFTLNFGITPDIKVQYVETIQNGGDYAQVSSELFENTPTLQLFKLHKYFNWADKKLHTVFFIENKDQISEDLLADFKGDAELTIAPNLIKTASTQSQKAVVQPRGIKTQADDFFKNPDLLHKSKGNRNKHVDVQSEMDFPSIGIGEMESQSKSAAQDPPPVGKGRGRGRKQQQQAPPVQQSWDAGVFGKNKPTNDFERERRMIQQMDQEQVKLNKKDDQAFPTLGGGAPPSSTQSNRQRK